ncbi:MAG: hypothetical protein ABI036_08190 [Fibrobacteria bacterium]
MSSTLIQFPIRTRLDGKDLAFLTQAGASLKLSLYFPFGKSWREPMMERTALKDLRRNAADVLRNRGALSGGIEAILGPLDSLLADTQAFQYGGEGMAFFSDGENATAVVLRKAPAPCVQIDSRFRLDGVLDQVSGRDRFYLLSLSQHAVRLWDCDGVSMLPISLEGLETDIRNTPHFQQAEYQAVFHSGASSGHGHSSSYAGIGLSDGSRMKKEIEVFFRAIDHGIQSRLPAKRQPLVLAGVGFLLPIYRTVNTYSALLASELPGNAEALGTPEDLHHRADALLQDSGILERNQALGTYVENLTRARSCAGYTDLVPLAVQGRLSHLFLAQGVEQWGEFEEANGRTTLFEGYRDGAVDLANLACVNAILTGAKAYAVPAGEMPSGAPIAGLYRE